MWYHGRDSRTNPDGAPRPNPERAVVYRVRRSVISVALIAVGAAFFFGTIAFLALPQIAAVTSPIESFLIITVSFLVFVLLTLSIRYADNRRKRISIEGRADEKISGILQRLNDIFGMRGKLSAHLFENLNIKSNKSELEDCEKHASEFLRCLIDETRFIFEDYTGQPCAASIKLLVSADDKIPLVKTYLRDKKSQLLRGDLYGQEDRLYRYDEHSPFVDIVTGKVGDHYICNDLRTAAANSAYYNGNKRWWKLYNSTIVVPIKDPSTPSFSENVVGFLCVDSVAAKFDHTICLHLSRIIANIIFYVIYDLSQIESKVQAYEKDSSSSEQSRGVADVSGR